jgi:hypothetical protein
MEPAGESKPAPSSPAEPEVECGICGLVGGERASMAHADAEHALRPVYECGHCGFAFWQSADLASHVSSVHTAAGGLPARECVECGDLFRSAAALNLHLRDVHAPRQPIMCRFCGLCCRGGDAVDAHVRRDHVVDQFLHCSQRGAGGGAANCSAFFMTSRALDEHVRLAHDNVAAAVKVGEQAGRKEASKGDADGAAVMGEGLLDTNDDDDNGGGAGGESRQPSTGQTAVTREGAKDRPHVQQTCFVCVYCGLRHSCIDELSAHVSGVHRSCAALDVALSVDAPQESESQSSLIPDGGPTARQSGLPRQGKGRGPNRWRPELDQKFVDLLTAKGLSTATLVEFQRLHSPSRSVASLRTRAYSHGFKRPTLKPHGCGQP